MTTPDPERAGTGAGRARPASTPRRDRARGGGVTGMFGVRLAWVGMRAEWARTGLIVVSTGLATLQSLAVVTVLAMPDRAGAYRVDVLAEPGLRPGLVVVLVGLTVPTLVFAGQCARLGGPERDRRLARYRIGGLDAAATVRVAAAEAGLAALPGAGLGVAAYFVLRAVAGEPDAHGLRALPADVLPSVPAALAAVTAAPVLITALSVLLLRPVRITPLGVVRRTRDRPVRPWPAALLAAGILTMAASAAGRPDPLVALLVLVAGLLLVTTGLVAGTGWLSRTCGRLLVRAARGPAALLAGHRLVTDPWAATRQLAVIVVALLISGGAAALHSVFTTQLRADALEARREAMRGGGYAGAANPALYDQSFTLLDIAAGAVIVLAAAGLLVLCAERIVTDRRALAAATASGIPRATLVRALLLQTLVPLVPAALLAVATGAATIWTAFGRAPVRSVGTCDASGACTGTALRAPVPWSHLAALPVLTIAVVLLATAAGTLVLRSGTRLTELRAE